MAEPGLEALTRVVETTDRWLRAQAWPLWLEHGVDWDRGGFHEHLCPSTLRCDAPFRRLRVAARQVYAFSHAARASLPKAHDAVELGLRSIRTDFSLSGIPTNKQNPDYIMKRMEGGKVIAEYTDADLIRNEQTGELSTLNHPTA